MLTATPSSKGSETVTQGVRVRVSPWYMPEHSDPEARRWVFGYRIRITNESDAPAQLISRHWIIVDAAARRVDVEGDGVVGQQPLIEPGGHHEYASYCPLTTPWGTLEGSYLMRRPDGSEFRANISRLYLVGPDGAP